MANAFDADENGKTDVAENNARLKFGQNRKGRFDRAELFDAIEILRTIHPLGPNFAIGRVVFNDGNGDAHALRLEKIGRKETKKTKRSEWEMKSKLCGLRNWNVEADARAFFWLGINFTFAANFA